MKYPVFIVLCSLLMHPSQAVKANSIKELVERKPLKVEGSRTGSVRERALKRLGKAQKLMASERYEESLQVLNSLEESLKSNRFGLSQVYQTKAYVYAQSDRFDKSIEYFEKVLDLKSLPRAPYLSTMYSLAQVYVAQEKYLKAVPLLQDYIFNKEPKRADAIFFYGQVLAQLKEVKGATEYVEKAIAAAKSPKETWLRLLVALYYEQKIYSKAALVLEQLVKLRPEQTKYWKQLSSVYLSMDQEAKALSVLELAYKNKSLKEEKDLLQLVRLSLYQEVPYKAGRYLEKALAEGKVEKNQKHYELLAESWIQAQELDLGLKALNKAAPLAKTGRIYVRQGQLYLEKEEWQKSISSLKKGLEKGGLKKQGLAHLALGIAYFNAGSKQLALKSFRKATEFPKFAKQAKEWINHAGS